MSNMSYCRYHNTVLDFEDCLDALQEPASEEEARKRKQLIRAAYELAQQFTDDEGDLDEEYIDGLPIEEH